MLSAKRQAPAPARRSAQPIRGLSNMSFLSHLDHLVERIPEGIQRTEDTIAGPSFSSLHSYYSGVLTSSPPQGFCTRIVRSSLLPSHSSLILRIGRHDTPEEKLNDDIRAQINASHRFQSFAGLRENNFVKWCVPLHQQTAFSLEQYSCYSPGT